MKRKMALGEVRKAFRKVLLVFALVINFERDGVAQYKGSTAIVTFSCERGRIRRNYRTLLVSGLALMMYKQDTAFCSLTTPVVHQLNTFPLGSNPPSFPMNFLVLLCNENIPVTFCQHIKAFLKIHTRLFPRKVLPNTVFPIIMQNMSSIVK